MTVSSETMFDASSLSTENTERRSIAPQIGVMPIVELAGLDGVRLIGSDGRRLAFVDGMGEPSAVALIDSAGETKIVLQRPGHDDFVIVSGARDKITRTFAVATREYRPVSRPELIRAERKYLSTALGFGLLLGAAVAFSEPSMAIPVAMVVSAGVAVWGWCMWGVPRAVNAVWPDAPRDEATRT